ncbi:MAG: winged helix-turn-helix domain-containing protein [Candidatus Kariarchaeaceae archaeon]|jgi:DNA-binding MarR family transcriptional regulator
MTEQVSNSLDPSEMNRAQITDHIAYLFSSDTKAAIVNVLMYYDMLNLKTLAKLLNKSSSTIHAHLDDLVSRNYIQVANTARGKYYEVTDFVRRVSSRQDALFEERDFDQEMAALREMTDEEFLKSTLDKFDDPNATLSPTLVANFADIMSNALNSTHAINMMSITATGESYFHIYLIYLLRLIKNQEIDRLNEKIIELMDHKTYGVQVQSYLDKESLELPLTSDQYTDLVISGIAEKRYRAVLESFFKDTLTMDQVRTIIPIGSTDNADFSVKFANVEQLVRYFEIVIRFYKDIRTLKYQLEDENTDIPEDQLTTQILSIFAGPLGKM